MLIVITKIMMKIIYYYLFLFSFIIVTIFVFYYNKFENKYWDQPPQFSYSSIVIHSILQESLFGLQTQEKYKEVLEHTYIHPNKGLISKVYCIVRPTSHPTHSFLLLSLPKKCVTFTAAPKGRDRRRKLNSNVLRHKS